jgi:hypothetical protein
MVTDVQAHFVPLDVVKTLAKRGKESRIALRCLRATFFQEIGQ